jgi:predicted dithiol-disulfide oxidoreductase (DUF899 family)
LRLGGRVPEDYVFDEGSGRQVKLSELFRDGLDTLLLYSYMFGAQAQQPCPMCTSFLDSLEGAAKHVTQRAKLAVAAKSPIGRIQQIAESRGWKNLRLLSSANNNYNRDYYGENSERRPVTNDERVCSAQRQDISHLRHRTSVPATGKRTESAAHRHAVAIMESSRSDARRPRDKLVPVHYVSLLRTAPIAAPVIHFQATASLAPCALT